MVLHAADYNEDDASNDGCQATVRKLNHGKVDAFQLARSHRDHTLENRREDGKGQSNLVSVISFPVAHIGIFHAGVFLRWVSHPKTNNTRECANHGCGLDQKDFVAYPEVRQDGCQEGRCVENDEENAKGQVLDSHREDDERECANCASQNQR